jgi:hypothetical protein
MIYKFSLSKGLIREDVNLCNDTERMKFNTQNIERLKNFISVIRNFKFLEVFHN